MQRWQSTWKRRQARRASRASRALPAAVGSRGAAAACACRRPCPFVLGFRFPITSAPSPLSTRCFFPSLGGSVSGPGCTLLASRNWRKQQPPRTACVDDLPGFGKRPCRGSSGFKSCRRQQLSGRPVPLVRLRVRRLGSVCALLFFFSTPRPTPFVSLNFSLC
jgi:hypothetical protein